MGYRHVLIAIDQVCSSDSTIKATQFFARQPETAITLLHAIKKLPSLTFYYSLVAFNNLETRYSQTVKNKLNYIAAVQDIKCNTLIDFGSTRNVIKKHTKEVNPDLIVINHGRDAKALLQSANCDMLVVSKK